MVEYFKKVASDPTRPGTERLTSNNYEEFFAITQAGRCHSGQMWPHLPNMRIGTCVFILGRIADSAKLFLEISSTLCR